MGDTKNYENYRGFSIKPTLSSWYCKVLKGLIELKHSDYEKKEQSGFHAGRFCLDNLFRLKQI